MNATIQRLRQLNPAVSDERIRQMIEGFQSHDYDGPMILAEDFCVSRGVARDIATNIQYEHADVYKQLDAMMDDMGLPQAG